MSDFEQSLRSANALDIALVTRSGATDYLCFTKYLEASCSWFLGVSDGAVVYAVKLSEEDVKARSGSRDYTAYLSELGGAVQEGRVDLVLPPSAAQQQQLTLRVRCPSGPPEEFFLSKVDDDDDEGGTGAGRELQSLLFSLVRRLTTVTAQLADCEKEMEDMRKKMGSQQPAFADVTMRSAGSKAASRPKKPAGHSLVNPSAKRRKAATGVVFGSQDS